MFPKHGEPFDWRKEKAKDIKKHKGIYLGKFEWSK